MNSSLKKLGLFICLLMNFAAQSGQASDEMTFSQHATASLKGGFDKTGFWILGLGAASTLLAFSFDQQTHDTWKDNKQMSADLSHYGDFWGTGIPQALIFSGQTYFDPAKGIPAFEGFIWGGLATHTAKLAIGRERPDSQTRTAMPSGHTQAAFPSLQV